MPLHKRSWILCAVLSVALAGTAVATSVSAQDAPLRCQVSADAITRSQHFEQLQIKALELDRDTCLGMALGTTSERVPGHNDRYLAFGIDAKRAAEAAFADLPVLQLDIPFDSFIEQIAGDLREVRQLPELRVEFGDRSGEWLSFHFDDPSNAAYFSSEQDNAACLKSHDTGCLELLDDLAGAINLYKVSYESLTAAATVNALNRLSRDWDHFLDDGRSQTLLDLKLTTWLERRHFRRGFLVGPPPRQWSLLHPDLVYEHFGPAPSGQRDQLALVVEWIGVNWWGENSPLFGVPFGVSLASVYADRAGGSSAGHGLLFHFDNRYSLGWTNRREGDGFYFSVDLLRLFDNKRERLERYRSKLEHDYRAFFSDNK